MSKRLLRLQARRMELVAQSEALRAQLAKDASSIRRKLDVGARVLTLLPLLRSLMARFRR
jgi:hypothetical protein